MGVPQVLKEILQTAGRDVDLRNFSNIHPPNQKPRRLRIAVDVSQLIHKATNGHSTLLGDDRHLTNEGRAQLHSHGTAKAVPPSENPTAVQEYVTTCAKFVLKHIQMLQETAEVLVVLDGDSPPIKYKECQIRSTRRKEAEKQRDKEVDTAGDEEEENKRIKAFRRAGAGKHFSTVIEHVLLALRENKIPFLVSPYESDGQLAYLLRKGYVDLIATEDSDLIAYGASPILYKLGDHAKEGAPKGILFRWEDIAANNPRFNFCDFSPAMMAVTFILAGSDYCDKLKGIGVLKACNIVREAFYTEPDKSPLEKVLERVFQETYDKSNLSPNDKETYKANFLKALLMFRHPVVYDPFLAKCVTVGDPDDLENGDVELLQYKPYAELVRDASRREEVVGKLLDPPIATMIAEGWISARSKRPYIETEKLPKYVRDYVEQVQLERHARAGQVSNVVVLDGEEGQPVESDKATNERQALESDPQEMQTQPVATVQVVETRTVTQVRIHLTTEDATVPVDGQGSQESVGEMDATELQTQAFSTGHETQPTQEGQSTTNKFSYTEEEEEEVEGVEESKRDEDAVLGGEARLEAQPPSSKRTSPERRTDGGKSEDQVSKRARLEDDTTGKVDTEQRNERLPIPLQMGEESQASQDDASSELGEDEPILCTQAF